MFDAQLYRSKEEIAEWRAKGPIVRFQTWLEENGLLHKDDIATIETEVGAEIAEAIDFAQAGTDEPVKDLTRFVMSPDRPAAPPPPAAPDTLHTTTYREAMKQAITDAMTRDDRVFLMGEDVGHYGGCYAVSMGLLEKFGPARIRDTPLSEAGFTGAGIGAAMMGMRPIVEIMTVNFSLLALDQILNTAATSRHMSNNQFGVPLVIRMATGAGKQLAAQHSHSLEGWYAHIPGLCVLAPATLEDARGMLWSALEDSDPVLIFENVMLYNEEGALAENAGPVNINKAALSRVGGDLTLITYGGSLGKTLAAAQRLNDEHHISTDVIDLRSLRPLDFNTILASVQKTRRALIVDEGWRTGSLAAEIGMRIAEDAFFELDAPLARVCSQEVPIPYPKHLEQAAIPTVDKIMHTATKLMMDRV